MNASKNLLIGLFLGTAIFNSIAQQKYPDRPITIVVPFAAGGATDAIARKVGQSISGKLGQPVIVENRPGMNGSVGATHVARAKADGHTILYGTSSTQAANVALYKNLAYDPAKDFSGVAIESESIHALFVNAEYKDLTLKQFVDRIKRDPTKIALGGAATTHELLDKQLRDDVKADYVYVKYNSTPTTATDLMAGRLAGAWLQLVAGLPYVQTGKMSLMAISSSSRLPSLPNVPSLSEVLPNVNITPWTGYFVPAGTPRAAVDVLSKATLEAFREPEIAKMIEQGGRPLPYSPQQVDEFVRTEIPKWSALIKSAGVSVN